MVASRSSSRRCCVWKAFRSDRAESSAPVAVRAKRAISQSEPPQNSPPSTFLLPSATRLHPQMLSCGRTCWGRVLNFSGRQTRGKGVGSLLGMTLALKIANPPKPVCKNPRNMFAYEGLPPKLRILASVRGLPKSDPKRVKTASRGNRENTKIRKL